MEFLENVLERADYCALRESVGWRNFPQTQVENAMRDTRYSILVRDGQRSVAMGRLLGDSLYALIVDVVVRPECQGKGIGSEILRRLLDFAAQDAPEGGRVSVQLIAEPGKEGFYERLGFRKIPHAHCGSGMRKVIHAQPESPKEGVL